VTSTTAADDAIGERIKDIDTAALERLVHPTDGPVYCHAPADRPFDLRALDRPDDEADRWSAPGTRTAYLARDPLVALAEYARHGPPFAAPEERRLVRLTLRPIRALDLRTEAVRSALGVGDDVRQYADRERARRLGLAIRSARICEGVVVPSMAFLDDLERSNVVIFCELVARGLDAILRDAAEVGTIRLSE
jgi:hypothetical protein